MSAVNTAFKSFELTPTRLLLFQFNETFLLLRESLEIVVVVKVNHHPASLRRDHPYPRWRLRRAPRAALGRRRRTGPGTSRRRSMRGALLPIGRMLRCRSWCRKFSASRRLRPRKRLAHVRPGGWKGRPSVESVAGGFKAKKVHLLLQARRL